MARGQSCLVLACLLAFSVSTSSAFVFKVGGTGEWRVPGEANASGGHVSSYNKWAEHTRFRVGDAVAFSYKTGSDSVLLVDKKSYDACDTGSPIDRFTDGNTVFTFSQSGPYYFISGNKDNCNRNRNEKLVVVVMGERAANGTSTRSTALAPSPGVSPFSPPSPPSPFGIEISPSGHPPANAAGSKAAGIAGAAALVIGAIFYALV